MTTVIAGERALPAGHAHVHASDEARALAEAGLVLRVQAGTRASADRPPRTVPFEQYERHTAWDRPGGLANRSGAGDLDVVVYSARKWARLALAGNPTVLLPLFVPDDEVVVRTAVGAELVGNAHRFVSRRAASRYLGYLRRQRRGIGAGSTGRTNRPDLVARHGYDTEYAMHAVRLGLQGAELLATGRITLPVPEPHRALLRAIRRGELTLAETLARVDAAEAELVALAGSSAVPDEPDLAWTDDWLHRVHREYWESGRL